MSSITSSEHSKAPTLGGYARRLSIKPKPSITIHINNHYRSKVYTTGDEVSGYVAINPQTDVRFDTLQIALLGTAKTRVDAVNIPQATAHTFLKLIMPIPESSYPVPRVFEAGMNYTVPFTFVIPSTLTLGACSHHVANESIQEHHVRLPPTVGSWEKDDFAPNMSRVQYVIKARAYRDEESGVSTKIIEAGREIRVLPAAPEDPPLNITKHDDLYTMSKSKTLRRTILSPKSGRVTITAQQPGAAMMSPDGQTITSTTVPLDLEFEPASGDTPAPKVTGVSSKITAVTYFSAVGINHYPNLKNWRRSFGSEGRGSYSGTASASTGSAGAVQWTRQLTAQARRDSGYGSEGPSSSSSDTDHSGNRVTAALKKRKGEAASPIVHTARLRVPVQVPATKKTFVPTFHSCIASRVYVLWLTVSLSCGGGGTAHVTLGVPLQIGVTGATAVSSEDRNAELPPSFQEFEEAEADEYWRPRVLGLPSVEFDRSGAGAGAPPGYADLEYRRRTVAAH
ncbi:hypothetical protein F4820DRAFT_308900 [Hypoxylon rubiginosum]|uniref:Uncharacterized protein n=1 Tax=Hypoxylon rubiginosum TaxID=110542 RepID=A0ACB9Z092_9PEZI|nr:hypothetical protein F4820DRAFT_308900 [Hypoxylon rubiginosum]